MSRPARLRKSELDEQLGANVTQVLDRRVQPTPADAAARGGRRKHHAVAALTGAAALASDETSLDQPVDGPVRQVAG